MRHKCILDTYGYQLVFYLQSLDTDNDCIGILVEFVLDSCYRNNFSVKSDATATYIKEVQRLITYLENHVATLKDNPGYESPAFVTYDSSFWVQAFAGEVCSESDGVFTINCMVNIGKGEGTSSTYVGGEAVISLQNTKNFISSLKTALTEVTNSN